MLRVENVTKRFGAITAVDDVSIAINKSNIFALLGPNGAGKTTLIRMILGLVKPDTGSITYLGAKADSRTIGYLPEDRGLYPDVSVMRTLIYLAALRGMPRSAATAAAETWLLRVGLHDRRDAPLKALSKGNQQKVQFISAVLHAPAFAVLDEPFSGLDPINQDFFLTLIRGLQETGTTVILSAHQMQLVERIADHIVVMNRGSVVLSGTMPEIRREWTTGSRIVLKVAGDANPAVLQSLGAGVRATLRGRNEIEVFVTDGTPLNVVLGTAVRALAITGIESHPVTLHDVYVDVIRAAAAKHETAEAGV